jgi:hypothetical protein
MQHMLHCTITKKPTDIRVAIDAHDHLLLTAAASQMTDDKTTPNTNNTFVLELTKMLATCLAVFHECISLDNICPALLKYEECPSIIVHLLKQARSSSALS